LVLESKKTTSTVVTATVVSLGLLAFVRITSGDAPARPEAAQESAYVPPPIEPLAAEGDGGAALIESAFQSRNTGQLVQLRGVVRGLLPDERTAPRHQRLTLELPGGRTLVVLHDVEASRRVPARVGDELELCGRYEWNNRGGLVCGTHSDPDDDGARGWIRHDGVDYR